MWYILVLPGFERFEKRCWKAGTASVGPWSAPFERFRESSGLNRCVRCSVVKWWILFEYVICGCRDFSQCFERQDFNRSPEKIGCSERCRVSSSAVLAWLIREGEEKKDAKRLMLQRWGYFISRLSACQLHRTGSEEHGRNVESRTP